MKGASVINVNVPRLHWTSLAEAGVYDLSLPDDARVVALSHAYFPDHDRSIWKGVVYPFLRWYRPQLVLLLGGMIHDDAFQILAPRRRKEKVAVHLHPKAPELTAVLDDYPDAQAQFEDRVLSFAARCGRFIESIADAGRSHVIYIGSAAPMMPTETKLLSWLELTLEFIKEWRGRHEDEAPSAPPVVPTDNKDFDALLGLRGHPQITCLPFGAGVVVNDRVLLEVGDFRRRFPGSAAYVSVTQRGKPGVRGFDGKCASLYWTTSNQTSRRRRRLWQAHDVPHSYDLARMGYKRDYDLRAQGLWIGRIVHSEVHGYSAPLLPGADGRRGLVFDGRAFQEDRAGGFGVRRRLSIRLS